MKRDPCVECAKDYREAAAAAYSRPMNDTKPRTYTECINAAGAVLAAALIRIECERLMAEMESELEAVPETVDPALSPERTARLAAEIRAELGRQNKRIPELAAGTGINAATLRRRPRC